MNDERKKPSLGAKALSEAETRRVRLAGALRENLKRRKAQSRERDAADPGRAADEPKDQKDQA